MRVLFRHALCFLVLLAAVGFDAAQARADTIVASTGGNQVSPSPLFPGIGLTTPSGPSFNNITFNWFSNVPATTPSAFGTLFILSQAYSGSPSGLSAATLGFLAQSQSISGGQYLFDLSLTLQPNTTYYFYTNAAAAISGGNAVPGITFFVSSFAGQPFSPAVGLGNFRLSGTPVAEVPEPATLLLLSTGLAGVAMRKKRKKGR